MKTWFISGVSSGFGKALAEAVLAKGERVVGTLRKAEQVAAFSASHPYATGIELDITDHPTITAAVARIEREIGAIDVLVNNAGYGYEGTVEAVSMDDARRQMEVNFFGTLAVIQAVLPGMRRRRTGHILNITSIGGLVTFPGLGLYHASKFALEGLSETLAKEVASFGIRVTAVEPGMFRTDWGGRSLVRGAQTIPDYEPMFAPIRQARLERSGRQAGDPVKAALAMIAAVEAEDAPVHLLLGTDALSFARAKLEFLDAQFKRYEALTISTNFE